MLGAVVVPNVELPLVLVVEVPQFVGVRGGKAGTQTVSLVVIQDSPDIAIHVPIWLMDHLATATPDKVGHGEQLDPGGYIFSSFRLP
jgi:hypothetical protein